MKLSTRQIFMVVHTQGEGPDRVQPIDVSEEEAEVIRTVIQHGFDVDVVCAYFAEVYPYNVSAPAWRRTSSTRNGVWVALFLNSVPDDDDWCRQVNRRLPGRGGALQKLFLAWIRGELFEELLAKHSRFRNASQNRLQPKLTLIN